MKRVHIFFILFWVIPLISIAQNQLPELAKGIDINFISDTQEPMMVEKIVLKSTQNIKATALLFSEILKTKPQSLYMLGDVVALGYVNHKWKKIDTFLGNCRKENTMVCGLLGNHDVMGRRKKGERKRLLRSRLRSSRCLR